MTGSFQLWIQPTLVGTTLRPRHSLIKWVRFGLSGNFTKFSGLQLFSLTSYGFSQPERSNSNNEVDASVMRFIEVVRIGCRLARLA